MLSHYGFVQVLRIKAYVQGTIRLAGIGEGRYPLSRLGDRCNHSLLTHIIKSALYLLPVLDGNLLPGMLDRGDIRVHPDGIGPGLIAYGMEGVWEGSLQDSYVLDHGGRDRGSSLCQLHLEDWLIFDVGGMRDVMFMGW